MRLIDAEELRIKIANNMCFIREEQSEQPIAFIKIGELLRLIDNAPTVETSIEHFVDMKQISKCANCDLMLIEKSKRCKE